MINPKHIPIILTILKEGSMTAAGKKLFVSQPALSQTVKTVESELGAPIFTRENGKLSLTYAGQLYLDAVQEMQAIDKKLHTVVAESKDVVYGEFTLGISHQRGSQLLPEFLPEFSRRYPHVKIRLKEEGSDMLEKMIAEGSCDMAFLTTDSRRVNLSYWPIQPEKIVLIAAKTTELAGTYQEGAELDIRDAAGETFVSMTEGHSVRKVQDKLFEIYDLHPNILLETHNMEAAKNIAARMNAVFLVPSVYIQEDMPYRELISVYGIRNKDYERHFYFCCRKDMYLTGYAKDMVRIVCHRLHVPCPLPED